MDNPTGLYPYPPEIDDWKAAHHFGFDEFYNQIGLRRRAVWLRRMVRIEELHDRIQYELQKAAMGQEPDDDDLGGAVTVYDKDKGGFVKGTPKTASAEQTPIEEFASFVNTKKPTMTTAELRKAARQIAKEQGG